jgi:hypothetical protein
MFPRPVKGMVEVTASSEQQRSYKRIKNMESPVHLAPEKQLHGVQTSCSITKSTLAGPK